jgi:hypothetical protein
MCDRYESNMLAIPNARFSFLTVDHEVQHAIRTRE